MNELPSFSPAEIGATLGDAWTSVQFQQGAAPVSEKRLGSLRELAAELVKRLDQAVIDDGDISWREATLTLLGAAIITFSKGEGKA